MNLLNHKPCPRCDGASCKAGINAQGRQRYWCRACRKVFTDATARLLSRQRERDEQRLIRQHSDRLRRARTLAEYVAVIDPLTGAAIARSPIFGEMMRRTELAKRKGISREYVRRLVKANRLFTLRIGDVEWVSARGLL